MKAVNSKYYHSSSITRATNETLAYFNSRFWKGKPLRNKNQEISTASIEIELNKFKTSHS